MKAFTVQEPDEYTGGVYFAKRDIEARKAYANEYQDGEIGGLICRRAPWADEYAGQAIPARVMIANNWWFECTECGSRIDEDWLHDHGLPLEGVIGTQSSHVFCSASCHTKWEDRCAQEREIGKTMIATLKNMVRRRFGDVEFVTGTGKEHYYVARHDDPMNVQQAFVSFKFPGATLGPASLRLDWGYKAYGPIKPHYTCRAGDREAFEAFAKATRCETERAIEEAMSDPAFGAGMGVVP